VSAVFAQTDRELWLLTARDGEKVGGLIASCVAHASIVPELPRVLVGIARHHRTWELMTAAGAFALHLLAEAQRDWVWRFGLQSGRDLDKFAGLSWTVSPNGTPLLSEAAGWLDCRIETAWDAGDRTFFLAEIIAEGCPKPGPLLTMKGLLQLASADQLQRLKACRLQDATTEAALIAQWRQSHRSTSPP